MNSKNKQTNGLLLQFLDNLAGEKDYRFSSPWRPKGSLAVIVPIIAAKPGTRDYIMLQESNSVELKDTGHIGGVSVTNRDLLPIFVRVGSIFKGNGTQSRAVNKSIFIEPGETIDVNVNCIHASHPIKPSAPFSPEKDFVAPSQVEQALRSGVQHEVWNRVSEYSSPRHVSSGNRCSADDMVNNLYSRDSFADLVDQLLKEVPNHEGQVGMAIIDEKGVYGLELFNHPDSWQALSKGIVTKYSDFLTRGMNENSKVIEVKVNQEKVHETIIDFISALGNSKLAFESSKNTKRAEIFSDQDTGEAVFREDRFVYLAMSRKIGRVGFSGPIIE